MTVSRLPFESTEIFLNSEIQSVFRSLRKIPVNSKSVAINPPSGEKCGLATSRRDDIDAVISISAFAHPDSLMRRYLNRFHIPRPITSAILRYVEWIIGQRFEQIAPVNTICKIKCPVLLVHGVADSTIPLDDAHEILQHCPQPRVQLAEIDGADHDSVNLIELHAHRLLEFLQQCGFNGGQTQ